LFSCVYFVVSCEPESDSELKFKVEIAISNWVACKTAFKNGESQTAIFFIFSQFNLSDLASDPPK